MNLPIAWATALPASLVAKQSVEQTLNSASHFFGDILRAKSSPENRPKENTESANGPSAVSTQTPKSKADQQEGSWAEQLTSLKKQLGRIVQEARTRWGLPAKSKGSEPVQFALDEAGNWDVQAQEPIRSEIRSTLFRDPKLVQDLQRVASTRPHAMDLNPSMNSPLVRKPNASDAFRIWID